MNKRKLLLVYICLMIMCLQNSSCDVYILKLHNTIEIFCYRMLKNVSRLTNVPFKS